jgi:hypothetical protein
MIVNLLVIIQKGKFSPVPTPH